MAAAVLGGGIKVRGGKARVQQVGGGLAAAAACWCWGLCGEGLRR